MSDYSDQPQSSHDDVPKSRFTYRDLRHLSQSSVTSPLRVISLVDFDCFYAQCEKVRLGLPDDQPLGVQQFNHVIAINYPARAAGLKKVVTAVEARQKCPNIVLQHVPTWREGDTTWAYREDVHQHMDSDKSSLDYYRLQSRKAIKVIKTTLPSSPPQKVEKAGIDELFLDLSAQVHAALVERYPELDQGSKSLDSVLPRPPSELLEWRGDKLVGTEDEDEDQRIPDWNDVSLNIGAEVVRNLRSEIRNQLGYTCSAGIARNKVIAKLAAGHNKPNGQTVVRDSCIPTFLSSYKFTKLRGLGGKLGSKAVKSFGTELVSELLLVPLSKLQSELGSESGIWVYRAIRGIEHSEVVSRTQIKSMMSAKTFTPSIAGLEQAERWLQIFAADIMGRMADQEGRRPRTIVVHHQPNGRFGPTLSKQAPIPLGCKLDAQCLLTLSRNILTDITRQESSWPCLTLSIGVSDFVDPDTSQSLTSFWTPQPKTAEADGRNRSLETLPAIVNAVDKPAKRTLLDYQAAPFPTSNRLPVASGMSVKRQRFDISPADSVINTSILCTGKESDGQYHCPTCAKMVPADAVLEHLDWHVAMDLQNQT